MTKASSRWDILVMLSLVTALQFVRFTTRLASWSNSGFSLAGAHFGVIFHNDYFCVHDVLFNSSPRRREGFYRAQASESKFFLFLILFLCGWFFFLITVIHSLLLLFTCLHDGTQRTKCTMSWSYSNLFISAPFGSTSPCVRCLTHHCLRRSSWAFL